MQTRDQKYAADAYQRVEAIAKDESIGQTERTRYGSMAHKLPVLIRIAGLTQALEFVNARGKDGHKRLLKDLATTVGKPEILVADARNTELSDYIYLTQQVMAALLWYKRFAQSVLHIEQGEKGDEE
jgi:CRISPR-associated protein Cmr5